MTLPAATATRGVLRRGGLGLLVGGVLQLLAALRTLPGLDGVVAPGWQLLGWMLGGIVLLVASFRLARGPAGPAGVVGPSRPARAALVVSGAGDLLLVLVAVATLVGGPSVWALATPVLAVAQLVVTAASMATALAVRRAGVLTGPGRRAFPALAVVDAVALVLALVPPATVAFLFVAMAARPVVVVLTGASLLLEARGGRAAAQATAGEA